MILVSTVIFTTCSCDKSTNNNGEDPPLTNFKTIDIFSDWSSTDWIVFSHNRYPDSIDNREPGLYKIRPDGSNPYLLYEGILLSYPAWSPDGESITFSKNGQICKISFDGTQFDTLTEKSTYFTSSWSPDGNHIACELRAGDDRGVWIMDSDGSNIRIMIPYAHNPDWAYSDSIVYVNFDGIHPSGSICITDKLGQTIRVILDVSDQFIAVEQMPEMCLDILKIIFNPQVPGELRDLWIINLDGIGLQRLTDFGARYPSFSPDGSRIAYTDTRNGYLWTMKLDGSDKIQVTGIQ